MRNYLILVLLAILPRLCGAQQADTGKWNQARNYLNYKLSLAAIREKAVADASVANLLKKDAGSLPAYAIGQAPDFAHLKQMLKDFPLVVQKLGEPLNRVSLAPMEQLAPEIGVGRLMDSAYAIVGKNYPLELMAIQGGTRATLTADLKQYLAVAASAPVVQDSPKKPVEAQEDVRRRPADEAGGFVRGGGFNIWVLLLLAAVVVMGIYFYRELDRLRAMLKSQKREAASMERGRVEQPSLGSRAVGVDKKEVERIIGNSNVLHELNEAVRALQVRIAQVERAGSAAGVQAMGATAGIAVAVKEKGKPAEVGEKGQAADVFYMSGPVNDYFPNSAKSLTKENTVYKFKVSANRQEAEFELHTTGAPVKEILQLVESFIKAACDEENQPNFSVKNIVTKRRGQVILDGDKWVIKRKALIQYE